MSRLTPLLLFVGAGVALWVSRPEAVDEAEGERVAPVAAATPGVVVVDLRDGLDAADVAAFEARYGVDLDYASEASADEVLLVGQVEDPAALLAVLVGDPLVEAAEPEVAAEAFGFPDDPRFSEQWNMQMIGQPFAWRAGQGRGVRVAVIDTGVSVVEDLEGVDVEAGRSFVRGAPTAADDHGHGTHVAGTIAQATHNGVGVTGVAPRVTLLPYKVLDARGTGTSQAIAAAIDQAVDDGADVMNLSLGGPYSRVVEVAVNKAVEAGVVVVAAAGNANRNGIGCPACLKPVIAVSALGPDGARAPYSSWGKGVEISAPGGDKRKAGGGILQDTIDGRGGHTYQAFQGTSMASPHVAGAVAVLIGMGLDGDSAVDVLLATARSDTPGKVDDVFGHGRLDLGAAVRSVLWRERLVPFALAGLLALGAAGLGGLGGAASLAAAFGAGAAAGGVFFLPYLPITPGLVTDLAARGYLAWPAAAGVPSWGGFPLWSSALVPLALVFLLGWTRRVGPLVGGLALGVGVSLLAAAAGGTVDVWLMNPLTERVWLGVNGLLSVGLALATFGVQRLRGREA